MANAEYCFTSVAERAVPDIVQQQARAKKPSLAREIVVVPKILWVVLPERAQNAVADGKCAERVSKARMFRGREREIREAELP